MLDSTSFVMTVFLVVGLVEAAKWLAPYENLTEAGCTLDYVYDGDTVSIISRDQAETARLIGFDTPETKNSGCAMEAALGREATLYLRHLASQGVPTFSGSDRDKYGRLLVTMRVDGTDVGDMLIDEGLAVPYRGGTRINWCERLG